MKEKARKYKRRWYIDGTYKEDKDLGIIGSDIFSGYAII
ncbi:hypothetical protein C5S53_04490 [Methanophagales archaeon]|nr:hypothetical protein C5S53_04490 [Methanophagales archaeon]